MLLCICFKNLWKESIFFWLPYGIRHVRCWAILNDAGNTTQWAQRVLRWSIILYLLLKPVFLLLILSCYFNPMVPRQKQWSEWERFWEFYCMSDINHPIYIYIYIYSNEKYIGLIHFPQEEWKFLSYFGFLVRILWMLSAIVTTWDLLF